MAAMHNTSGRYAQFMRQQCTTVAEVAEKIPDLTVRSTGSAPPEWWLPHAGHPALERRNSHGIFELLQKDIVIKSIYFHSLHTVQLQSHTKRSFSYSSLGRRKLDDRKLRGW